IFIAKEVPGHPHPLAALMDMTVDRNAFGRQVDSFEADLDVPDLGTKPFHAVFIRAPRITRVGPGVEVLAELDGGMIVAARQGMLRVSLAEYRGQLRSTALVYDGHRPEWVLLILAALPEPGGADSAFRLLSGVSGAAARAGMHRIFAAVPDETRARETFFQAGFYSYTRETWFAAARTSLASSAHATTPR